jgi:hypothetical protein
MDVSCGNDLKLHIVIPVDESEGSALEFGFPLLSGGGPHLHLKQVTILTI